jgi:hypothetical protein
VAVAAISIFFQQQLMYTVIYSLTAMWVMGIVSQIMVKQLYISIVKPLELSKLEAAKNQANSLDLNINEIEAIDSVIEEAEKSTSANLKR